MTEHVLKTKEPFFSAVKSGAKTFEVRQYTEQRGVNCCFLWNDIHRKSLGRGDINVPCDCKPARDFKVGDELKLVSKEDPEGCCPIYCDITYVLKDTDYPEGIKPGFCVLGIKVIC